jgi:hypothetical protein
MLPAADHFAMQLTAYIFCPLPTAILSLTTQLYTSIFFLHIIM